MLRYKLRKQKKNMKANQPKLFTLVQNKENLKPEVEPSSALAGNLPHKKGLLFAFVEMRLKQIYELKIV